MAFIQNFNRQIQLMAQSELAVAITPSSREYFDKLKKMKFNKQSFWQKGCVGHE